MKICEFEDVWCPYCHADNNLIVDPKTRTVEMGVFHVVTCKNCGGSFLIECQD